MIEVSTIETLQIKIQIIKIFAFIYEMCFGLQAVSTSSVMSDRVCIASVGAIQVNISAQQLAACCVDCGMGCNGGYPDKAWPFFFEHGLVTGGDYDSSEVSSSSLKSLTKSKLLTDLKQRMVRYLKNIRGVSTMLYMVEVL